MVVSTKLKEELRLGRQTPESRLLRSLLENAVGRAHADALLFSGRIDSAALLAFDKKIPVYTAGLAGEADDLVAGRETARELQVEFHGVEFTRRQGMENLRTVVRLLGSYDLGLKNDLVFYMAAKEARNDGRRVLRVGDYGDELFLGYGPEPIQRYGSPRAYIEETFPHSMSASAVRDRAMGIDVDYPYADSRIVDLAKLLRTEDNLAMASEYGNLYQKVKDEESGIKAARHMWAKLTLRRAMHGLLSEDVIYRPKAALEIGGGTYQLEKELASLATLDRLTAQEAQSFRFINRAHIGLYIMFKEEGLTVNAHKKEDKGAECGWCTSTIRLGSGGHCQVCGGEANNRNSGHTAVTLLNHQK